MNRCTQRARQPQEHGPAKAGTTLVVTRGPWAAESAIPAAREWRGNGREANSTRSHIHG